MKLKTNLLILSLWTCFLAQGQQDYTYKRDLTGISEQWHKIVLPEDVFGKLSKNLNDLRIFGITATNDTLEAPYLLQLTKAKESKHKVAFQMLNTSYNEEGFYFTFEISETEPINQIELDFEQKNFDWKLKLEGSQNLKEWFTIAENFRVVAIQNQLTNYEFSKLVFPNSKYKYYRLMVDSDEKPLLAQASILQRELTEGVFNTYPVKELEVTQNKKTKQTEISLELVQAVPLSRLKINVKNSFDFYRPIEIRYRTDSIQTERGWIYNYRTLTTGVLTSIENNEFNFSSARVQHLKIQIDNQDNQPLNINSVEVKGYVHELIARFTEPASYYLYYGNPLATQPNYDISRFRKNLPEHIPVLQLGKEEVIKKDKAALKDPLFTNKIWLWLIMILIIMLLGWFSIQMMRKK